MNHPDNIELFIESELMEEILENTAQCLNKIFVPDFASLEDGTTQGLVSILSKTSSPKRHYSILGRIGEN